MKKLKKLLLGTLAGLIWFYAISLIFYPIFTFCGILPAIGCILGGVALFGVGCTVALMASGKG